MKKNAHRQHHLIICGGSKIGNLEQYNYRAYYTCNITHTKLEEKKGSLANQFAGALAVRIVF